MMILIATLVLGCTGFTCEMICDQENCCVSLILFLLFPIAMIGGIGRAFAEVFCPAAEDILENNCGDVGDVCENMLCW